MIEPITNMSNWPAQIRPLGILEAHHQKPIRQHLDRINEAKYIRISQPIQWQLERELHHAISVMVAMPDEIIPAIKLDAIYSVTPPTYALQFNDHERQLHFRLKEAVKGTIDRKELTTTITKFAVRFRQRIAQQRLLEQYGGPYIHDNLDHRQKEEMSDTEYLEAALGQQYGLSSKPCHPGAMLVDPQITGMDFLQQYDTNIEQGPPDVPWIEWLKDSDTLVSLKLEVPMTIEAHLNGMKLHELLQLPADGLAKLPAHAREAWLETSIDKAYNRFDGRLCLFLKPARQIIWFGGALPHDHVPTTAIEQAIVNLAISGEIV